MTREQFEDFLSSEPYELNLSRCYYGDSWTATFIESVTQLAWEVLQEAERLRREEEGNSSPPRTLKITLPDGTIRYAHVAPGDHVHAVIASVLDAERGRFPGHQEAVVKELTREET